MTNRIQSVIRMIGFESLSQQGLMFFCFPAGFGNVSGRQSLYGSNYDENQFIASQVQGE